MTEVETDIAVRMPGSDTTLVTMLVSVTFTVVAGAVLGPRVS